MANREPFWLGPLWGAAIACLTASAWVASLVTAPNRAATAWRDTALGKRPDDWLSPVAASCLATLTMIIGLGVGGYDALPLAIPIGGAWLVPPALRRPGLAAMLVVGALYLPLLGATGL
ncbi:MAG: hypothetical protein JRE81_17235, partial [Deltaproteobacteria bacterium]|nr:hypothetical protein [Deltaproteobacteria bacterium]